MAKKTTPKATKAAPKRKQTATSKETGGGGGIFEEQVFAYFLADLLTGWAPFEVPGARLGGQTRRFLEQWWLHLAPRPTEAVAQQVWQDMVDAALASATRTIRAGRQFRYALGEVWRTLLGLIPLVRWPVGLQPLVARWGRWAASHVGNGDRSGAGNLSHKAGLPATLP
jgi:hypothetical protein